MEMILDLKCLFVEKILLSMITSPLFLANSSQNVAKNQNRQKSVPASVKSAESQSCHDAF